MYITYIDPILANSKADASSQCLEKLSSWWSPCWPVSINKRTCARMTRRTAINQSLDKRLARAHAYDWRNHVSIYFYKSAGNVWQYATKGFIYLSILLSNPMAALFHSIFGRRCAYDAVESWVVDGIWDISIFCFVSVHVYLYVCTVMNKIENTRGILAWAIFYSERIICTLNARKGKYFARRFRVSNKILPSCYHRYSGGYKLFSRRQFRIAINLNEKFEISNNKSQWSFLETLINHCQAEELSGKPYAS